MINQYHEQNVCGLFYFAAWIRKLFYFILKFSVSLRLCGGVLQGGDLWSGEFVMTEIYKAV